jgi:hypothetical protein
MFHQSWSKLQSRPCREDGALPWFTSNYRRVWRQRFFTINSILDHNVVKEGLELLAAVSLVIMADCMRSVPGLSLYLFCSFSE